MEVNMDKNIRKEIKEYSKYLHDITELAINKEKFYEEIIRVNS